MRKKGTKRSKSETVEVKITVAVMENNKVKRGNSLPLKVPAASTALVPLFNKRLNDLRSVVEESETESFSSDESLTPSVTNLLAKYDQPQESVPPTSCVSSTSQTISFLDPSIASTSSSYHDVETTATSSVIKVECPLCFQSFPINQVEAHAGECVGSFGLVEDNTVEVCPVNDISDTELSTNESKSDDYTLLHCISDLKENGLKLQMEMIRVTVRRKMVWEDFKRARYRYYQPDRLLKVTFAGDPAVDDGGPKREFFAGTLDTLLFAKSF